MPNVGFLNGDFMPLEDLKVSAEDRGFQFGDGVYEMIRTYGGVPFALDEHLSRLGRSADEIHIRAPLDAAQWKVVIQEGIRKSGYESSKVYIQITRGTAARNHHVSSSLVPTVVMTIREMVETAAEDQAHGVQAITLPDLRWGRCDIKSLNLLPNVLAKRQATQVGAFEAIFVRNGFVAEGSSSNVLMVKDGVVYSPELDEHVLAGVTLNYVMRLAREKGFDVNERAIEVDEMARADELFLVGTTIEVLPISKLNQSVVGNGQPGPVTCVLKNAFSKAVEKTLTIRHTR